MPGFSFSPSLRNHRVVMLLKSGGKLSGTVVSVDPAKIVLKLNETDKNVVIVNRDEVVAYTGADDKERVPVVPCVIVTRCCNPVMRCNGVKTLARDKTERPACDLYNEHCEVYHGNFFTMGADSQAKLLTGLVIGAFPKRKEDDSKTRAK